MPYYKHIATTIESHGDGIIWAPDKETAEKYFNELTCEDWNLISTESETLEDGKTTAREIFEAMINEHSVKVKEFLLNAWNIHPENPLRTFPLVVMSMTSRTAVLAVKGNYEYKLDGVQHCDIEIINE